MTTPAARGRRVLGPLPSVRSFGPSKPSGAQNAFKRVAPWCPPQFGAKVLSNGGCSRRRN